MATSDTTSKHQVWKDRRTVLTAAWVFLLFNVIYADIFTLSFNRSVDASGMNAGAILFFAVVMETAIAMTFLSRFLPRAWNRWSNIGAAVVQTALLAWSVVDGPTTSYYKFFVVIEVATLLFVIGYAWTWRRQPQAEPAALRAAA